MTSFSSFYGIPVHFYICTILTILVYMARMINFLTWNLHVDDGVLHSMHKYVEDDDALWFLFWTIEFCKMTFFLFILGPAEYIFLQKCILSENNLHSKYTLASILLENNLNSKIIIISSKLLRLELNFAPLLLHTTMPWWHKCRTNGKCLLNAHNRKLVWGSTVKSSATLSGSKLFSDIYRSDCVKCPPQLTAWPY